VLAMGYYWPGRSIVNGKWRRGEDDFQLVPSTSHRGRVASREHPKRSRKWSPVEDDEAAIQVGDPPGHPRGAQLPRQHPVRGRA